MQTKLFKIDVLYISINKQHKKYIMKTGKLLEALPLIVPQYLCMKCLSKLSNFHCTITFFIIQLLHLQFKTRGFVLIYTSKAHFYKNNTNLFVRVRVGTVGLKYWAGSFKFLGQQAALRYSYKKWALKKYMRLQFILTRIFYGTRVPRFCMQ